MKNNRLSRYAFLRNLKDIEREKSLLKKKIHRQEEKIETNWNEIYEFWDFVPKLLKSATTFAKKIPSGFKIVSTLFDLFIKK